MQGDTLRLYVGNIPYDWGEADIRNAFAGFGVIADVHIPRFDRLGSQDIRVNPGRAFVEFALRSCGEEAIATMNGTVVQGRKLAVRLALPAKSRVEGRHQRT